MGKPANYEKDLPRVSEIVEWAYPFTENARERFEDWLWRKDIEYSDYMGEASSGGRYVHKELEKFAITGKSTGKKYRGYVEAGIKFVNDYGVKFVSTETYLSCESYQGTCDAVVEIEGETWIIDWKTFFLAKDKFGISKGEKIRKPTDKLKKATLQLSLYNKIIKADKIGVVWLMNGDYRFYELKEIDERELARTITIFKEMQGLGKD